MADREIMTAAGVCDECGSGIDTTLEAGSFGMYRGETISCPNCTHQTPAERVVEAARDVARIAGGHWKPIQAERRLIEALAALDGGKHG